MPARKSRLFERFTGGARFGDGSNYSEFDNKHESQPGRMTLTGTARVRKEIFVMPNDFHYQIDDGFGNKMLIAGSVRLAASSTIMVDGASVLGMPVLIAGTKVAAAGSQYLASTVVPVPTDIDTSGSVVVYVDYTLTGAHDADDHTLAMYAALQYFPTGGSSVFSSCAMRTAACIVTAASYPGTASGEIATATLSGFPSFGANDRYLFIQTGWDANASPGNTDSASAWAIIGLRIQYTAKSLGFASGE